jgi:uncharacterized membrane protein YoaK (UPF0700 family)
MATPIDQPELAHFSAHFPSEPSTRFPSQESTPLPTRPSSSLRLRLKDDSIDIEKVNLGAVNSAGQQAPLGLISFPRFKHHMMEELSLEYSWIIIMCCFFSSGIIDAISFNSWSVFVELQTGNTIFTGLSLSHQPASSSHKAWTKALISIVSFCIGSFVFCHFHRHGGVRRRAVVATSFLVQFLCVAAAAAALATTGVVSSRPAEKGEFSSGAYNGIAMEDCIDRTPLNWADLAPMSIFAFQASGQVYMSRVLGYNDLPTIALTTLYCDFMSNLQGIWNTWVRRESAKDFFFVEEKKQVRRVMATLLLFAGAAIGGFASKIEKPKGRWGCDLGGCRSQAGYTCCLVVLEEERAFDHMRRRH